MLLLLQTVLLDSSGLALQCLEDPNVREAGEEQVAFFTVCVRQVVWRVGAAIWSLGVRGFRKKCQRKGDIGEETGFRLPDRSAALKWLWTNL